MASNSEPVLSSSGDEITASTDRPIHNPEDSACMMNVTEDLTQCTLKDDDGQLQNGASQETSLEISGDFQESGLPQSGDFQESGLPQSGDFQESGLPQSGEFQESGLPQSGEFQESGLPQSGDFQESETGDPQNLEECDDGFDDDDGLDVMSLTLLTLPPELIWCIFDFIDARFVIQQVSLVCKQLYRLINQDVTWKVRISNRFPKRYPIIPVDDAEFNWKLACIQREEQHTMWKDHENTMESFCLSMGHFASVDTVHLVQNGDICISGSRDRHVQVWDLRHLDASKPIKECEDKSRVRNFQAHKGWVWHITSLDNIMVTSSWDCWLGLWDMDQDFAELRRIKGKSAFLSTVFLPDILVSGSYDKTIYVHDHRADDPLVERLHLHNKPVLSVAADSQYIISASEDKTIAVYDRCAGKLLKQVKLKSFSMGMSYGFNQLWTGQKDGKLHVFDTTHGKFDLVETYDSGHKGKVTDVIHNLGAVITSSTDKTVKVHEPNHNPSTVTTHTNSGDITGLYLQNNVLASSCSDCTVGIWRPKAK